MNEHYNARIKKNVSEQEWLDIEISHYQKNYKLPYPLAQDVALKVISLIDAIKISPMFIARETKTTGAVRNCKFSE